MRSQFKRVLQIVTALSLSVFIVLFLATIWVSDGSLGWLEIVQGVVAPFELFLLAILWAAYVTYPSLVRSLAGDKIVKEVNTKALTAQKASSPPSTAVFRIISVLSIVVTLFGIFLLVQFTAAGGPNKGAGSHIFHSADLYLDMKVGLACISIGVVLAVANHVGRK